MKSNVSVLGLSALSVLVVMTWVLRWIYLAGLPLVIDKNIFGDFIYFSPPETSSLMVAVAVTFIVVAVVLLGFMLSEWFKEM